MSDLWEDVEGFGSGGAEADGDDDWDEGEESLEMTLEDGFDDVEELEEDELDEEDE
jgi:hypothetical protein